MLSAFPADNKNDVAIRDIDEDIVDHRSDEPLTRSHGCSRCVPGRLKVRRKSVEVLRNIEALLAPHRFHRRFTSLHTSQGLVPVLLKLCGNQAVVQIAGRVEALRETSFIPRLLLFELKNAGLILMSLLGRRFRFYGSFDCYRCD